VKYITTLTKQAVCPLWKEEISINGKYSFSENNDNPYEATFMYALCPILENLRLPKDKQNKDYEFFRYCNYDQCKLLTDFKPSIDVRNGYS